MAALESTILNNKETQKTEFIQFGCWNNLNVDESNRTKIKGCLTDAMELLNNYIEQNRTKIHSIVVSGDNYYPDKKKDKSKTAEKIKFIDKAKLKQGFELLPKNIPITMILGNHDLETNLPGDSPYRIKSIKTNTTTEGSTTENTQEIVRSCEILTTQNESIKSIEGTQIDYCFFKEQRLNDHTLLIMLDTSIYDDNDNYKYLSCYNKFFTYKGVENPLTDPKYNNINIEDFGSEKNDNTNTALTAIKEYQKKLITDALSKNPEQIKNIVLVGHHPICQIKLKKEKTEIKTDIPGFLPVLSLIKENSQPGTNYYYLCSDLHLYQSGIITINTENQPMKINQFIAGIGGTELDDITALNSVTKKLDISVVVSDVVNGVVHNVVSNFNLEYEMNKERADCGFLVCDYTNTPLNFDPHFIQKKSSFNQGAASESSGGRRTKRRRNKKTKKLKIHRKTKEQKRRNRKY
jgi:hypothetical protein